jgi:hypothetical protein
MTSTCAPGLSKPTPPARRQERMELDDLVDLSFLLPNEAKFLHELKAGKNLSVLFHGPGKDHVGFTLPMPVVDLEPLFKTCRL